MSSLEEKSSIFKKTTSDFLLNKNGLLECPLFENIINAQTKIWFMRIYEGFMAISKSKDFKKFKVAFYKSQYLIDFKYSDIKTDFTTTKIIKSFQIIHNKDFIEFSSPNGFDMLKINKILKTKLNLCSFSDKFKCRKIIGKGNFASVFMANNLLDNKFYAVKAMSKSKVNNQKNGFMCLENEIKILRSIDSPNLIKLDCVYESENSYYMIFELFSGGNLREYVKEKGAFSEFEAASILKNIMEGVKYLHDKNIMHRDIKPENILFRNVKTVTDKSQVVLADFGLATSNDVSQYIYPRCGTPGFVAPEIYAISHPTEHYSLKCDLYSLGITLYYMLTGELPYSSHNLVEENRKGLLFLNKSTIYKKLLPIARDLIGKLVCPLDKRIDINEALNHRFFEMKLFHSIYLEEELQDDDEISAQYSSVLLHNIKNFNERKFGMEEKNIMNIESPFKKSQKKELNQTTMDFITLIPVLTGCVKTVKSFKFNFENLNSEDPETQTIGSTIMNNNTKISHHFQF